MYKKENIFYAVLLLVAIYLAVSDYGVSSTFQTIAVFFCIVQAVKNIVVLYEIAKSKISNKSFPYNNHDIFVLLLTWAVVIAVYFGVLTAYFQKLVLYLVFFIVLLLFAVNYLRSVLRR
jgi:hypothetical protein